MTETTRKARVTDENKKEAEALKKLYGGKPHNGKPQGLSQSAFGAQYGIGSQSVVWQYLNARIPLNLGAATGFARGLGCKIGDFSPRLAKEATSLQTEGTLPGVLSFLRLDDIEAQLVGLYRELDDVRRADLLQHANKLHNELHTAPSRANPYPKPKRKSVKEGN